MLEAAGHASRRAARARLPVPPGASPTSSPSTTSCSWSSRTATRSCACCSSTNAASIRRGWCPILHYDGTPITARFIVRRDRRKHVDALKVDAAAEGGPMTYIAKPKLPPPAAAEQRARLHAPRLRGLGLDAVRRLRPRLDQRGDHPGLLRAAICRRTGSPSSPASAARRRRRPTSSATRTASTRVHGRMPSVLTGANLANRDLIYLGVSGDGDSASIGLGQFAHAMRRGVNMVYIVENNGVYGLTKGQFSATSDRGSKSQARRGQHRQLASTWSRMALQLGATFVARSFSGDKDAAGAADQGGDRAPGRGLHRRASRPASRSTTTPGSTKSFDYVREHNEAVNRLDFITGRATDHGRLRARRRWRRSSSTTARCCALRKLAADYDSHDRIAAMTYLQERAAAGEIVDRPALRRPRAGRPARRISTRSRRRSTSWREAELCPGSAALEKINASLR